MPSLVELIKKAIAKKDIKALYELKDICDRIHSTGKEYKGYKPKDLPPDSLYEEMVRLIDSTAADTTEFIVAEQTDISEKFAMIGESIIKTLSSAKASSIKLEDKHLLGHALQITIRGEIVLKDRTLTNTAPASVVAGKINGGIDVWTNAVDTMEFIPYEIIRINYDLTDYYNYYVPTQLETITMFDKLKLIHFPYITADLNKDQLPLIQEHFGKLNHSIPQPMDGVVYCSTNWRYPTLNKQTKPKQYGKYAWKPSSEATSTLKKFLFGYNNDI